MRPERMKAPLLQESGRSSIRRANHDFLRLTLLQFPYRGFQFDVLTCPSEGKARRSAERNS